MTDDSPKPIDTGAKPEEGQDEPSMEDILTSIRRILSEEGDEGEMVEELEELDEVSTMSRDTDTGTDSDVTIELEETEADRQPHSVDASTSAQDVVEDSDNVLLLTPEMRAPASASMVSPATVESSSDVLSQLAKAILNHRDIVVGSQTATIEGMVREMLRPMLKEWLDRNLPYLIERLVKKEIDLMVNRAERLGD